MSGWTPWVNDKLIAIAIVFPSFFFYLSGETTKYTKYIKLGVRVGQFAGMFPLLEYGDHHVGEHLLHSLPSSTGRLEITEELKT